MDRWEEPPIPNRLLVQLEDRRDLVDGEEFLGVCHERKAIGRGKRHLVAFRVQPPDSNGVTSVRGPPPSATGELSSGGAVRAADAQR